MPREDCSSLDLSAGGGATMVTSAPEELESAETSKTPRGRQRQLRLAKAAAHVEAFCEQTSIHGLKYIGARRSPWPQRILWTAAVMLAVAACFVLMGRAWRRWRERPVVVAMDERLRPIFELPFPAVTICPETRVRTAVFNYTDAHLRWRRGDITKKELQVLSATSLLCDAHLFRNGSKWVGPRTIDLLEMASPWFNETVTLAKWQGQLWKVPELFQPLMTEEVLCYSFNMLHYRQLFSNDSFQSSGRYLSYAEAANGSQWDSDGGYVSDAGPHALPRRALGEGAQLGLSVVLRTRQEDEDFLCKGPAQGFKIQLHSPAEFPRMSQQYFRAQLDHDLVVAVSPQVMSTGEELRAYSPAQRQCFLAGERPLRFFRVYTQQNCALECLANATRRTCGCSALYMPREANATICGTGSLKCVQEARESLVRRQVERGLRGAEPLCGCLQACAALSYSSERSHARFDWARTLAAAGESSQHSAGYNMARVHIFFRDGYFIGSRRSELYGNTDFLANCGGLLGLGLGVSALSLVELLFWLLGRLIGCCLRPQGHTPKSDHTNDLT